MSAPQLFNVFKQATSAHHALSMKRLWRSSSGQAGRWPVPAKVTHNRFGSVVGAWLVALAGVLFCNEFIGLPLIYKSYDLPFDFSRRTVPQDAVIVRMDDASHQELGLSYHQPWNRDLHARLLERLTADGARTVVFDVLFSDTAALGSGTNPSADAGTARLAAAMKAHGKTVIASHLRKEAESGFVAGFTVEEPDPAVARNAKVGLSEVQEDKDVVTRRLPTSLRGPAGRLPTLSWQAAVLEQAPVAAHGFPVGREKWLNYYGPPGTLPFLSYYRALIEAPKGFFKDKIVLIGPFYPIGVAGVRVDTFGTPFTVSDARFHGVELHATALMNLLHGEWLRRWPGWMEFVTIAAFGALIGAWLPRLKPWGTAAVAVLVIVGLTLCFLRLHVHAHFWFPWLIPVAVQIPVAVLWALLFHAIKGHISSAVLERSLVYYVSPKQVANILSQPELLKAGGSEQRVSILFSDIANFSKFSERMAADDLLQMLNRYCEVAIGRVHEAEGTVVKIIGDAIFAIWNAPQPQENHELLACRAAWRLHETAVEFAEGKGMPPLRTRIGLHVGQACVGNLGSHDRFDYTAVGREVNLASRLESLNKTLGTSILVSREIAAAVKSEFRLRWLGYFRLRGFDTVVEVHEVLGPVSEAPGADGWVHQFREALHEFHRGRLAQSRSHFESVLALQPGDGPARFYLDYLAEIDGQRLPSDWTGDVVLKEK